MLSRLAVALLLVPLLVAVAFSADRPTKKFIELGWDQPSTQYLRENWRRMDAEAPFDGVIYYARVTGDNGQECDTNAFWDARPWQREWFAGALADLRSCHFTRLTSNFVRVNATPGTVDWFDDRGWEALSGKAGLIGWMVRESGQAGVCLDFESYGDPQFGYQPSTGRTFAETAAKARQRGAQFMRALAAEAPDCTVLTLWLNSVNFAAGEAGGGERVLAGDGQGLLPAFVNGMLEAIPPRMTLVDGCESAYRFDGEQPYLTAFNRIRSDTGPAAALVAPENLHRYRDQVQAGFGFYLDAYFVSADSPYHLSRPGVSRLDLLRENLTHARRVTDQYVWVYGEEFRWWPKEYAEWQTRQASPAPKTGRSWEEAMPGITRAIRWARDPVAAASEEVAAARKAGTLVNLAANPGFEEGAQQSGAPKEYGSWQEGDSHGTFALDTTVARSGRASGRIAGVNGGCFIQTVSVKAGEQYAMEAYFRNRGTSAGHVMIRWQTAEGRWTREDRDTFLQLSPADATGWERAFGAVEVPEGAGKLVVLLTAGNQRSESDACWFDDVGVYRLAGR